MLEVLKGRWTCAALGAIALIEFPIMYYANGIQSKANISENPYGDYEIARKCDLLDGGCLDAIRVKELTFAQVRKVANSASTAKIFPEGVSISYLKLGDSSYSLEFTAEGYSKAYGALDAFRKLMKTPATLGNSR